MIDVYKYMRVESANNIAKYGMKLSADFDKKFTLNDTQRLFFSTFLNPKDAYAANEAEKEYVENGEARYVCVRIEVELGDCYIADKSLYYFQKDGTELTRLYLDSLVEAGKYNIGAYRTPECLVGFSVPSKYIHIEEDPIETIAIVENAEGAYIKNVIGALEESQDAANEMLLYCYFEKMTELGNFSKWENKKDRELLYRDMDGKFFVLSDMKDMIEKERELAP